MTVAGEVVVSGLDTASECESESDFELDLALVEAERQWQESLQQLSTVLTCVVLPIVGKFLGRKVVKDHMATGSEILFSISQGAVFCTLTYTLTYTSLFFVVVTHIITHYLIFFFLSVFISRGIITARERFAC
ncbi:Mim2p KNAG_0G02150 [Huiozyma naganishii CBS 8797]|uniref:Uncharacterized protein n=1 Tax=Huiozyma naganishii (strain ATCC MYA-139 / BCRC 22969 / CBS 8797 / KCTC 17520 / NBRC 10181 / NCYC 3082 / Yp74L-3) TaxID=1071383 RepID=J7S125_HUIN7|nr:hypothetical protein KNAG_0G02150 [Kazachstania naganishii CBS 8797]CCK71272.1 hypothetical protein KNAG_0G02150 [Kazachstania naganishii CBS 8797]